MSYNRQLHNQRSSFNFQSLHMCLDCTKVIPETDRRCVDCHVKYLAKKSQEILFVNQSFCPRCKMSLGEHKETELKLCLYNLRGYLTTKEGERQ